VFKCQKYGYTASQCDKVEEDTTDKKRSVINTLSVPNRMLKEIDIDDISFDALLGTGSQVIIISKNTYNRIKSYKLIGLTIYLTGLDKKER